jgi:hypothetical protein
MTVNWGDNAPETRQISGKLTSYYSVIDANGPPLDFASVSRIHFTLTNVLTGMRYETSSNSEGLITFGSIAGGVYVLHSDPDERRHYAAGDLLIRVNPTAARTELVLKLGGGGTDCGSPLELTN